LAKKIGKMTNNVFSVTALATIYVVGGLGMAYWNGYCAVVEKIRY